MGKSSPTQASLPRYIASWIWLLLGIAVLSLQSIHANGDTVLNDDTNPQHNIDGVLSSDPTFNQSGVLGNEEIFYNTTDNPIHVALSEISFLTKLRMQGVGLPADLRVSGEFSAPNTLTFLNNFCNRFALDWFYSQDLVIITARAQRRQFSYTFKDELAALNFRREIDRHFPLHSNFGFAVDNVGGKYHIDIDAPEAFHLQSQQLFDQQQAQSQLQLGPDTTKDKEKALPSTPRLLQAVQTQTQRSVMRFVFKHAWVEDRQIGDLRFPGIVKVFTELVKASHGNVQIAQAPATSSTSATPSNLLQSVTPFGENDNSPETPAALPTQQATSTGSKNQPVVAIDSRTNAVLIYDDIAYYDFYRSLVDDLDQPLQMVELQAMIIDVDKNNIDALGISWSGKVGNGDTLSYSGGFDTTGPAQLGDINLIVNSGNFLARLRALNETGRSKVISQPSVLAMDNHTASIETKDKFYVRVQGNAQASSALFPVETGTMLHVTPHVVDDEDDEQRRIQLLVAIKDGTINREADALVDSLPTISERNINTQAVVYHGESLLIGGQVHTTTSTSKGEVPGLSQIPLLGGLFTKSAEVNRELVRMFLLRPNIVEMSYSRVTESEQNLSQIDKKHLKTQPTRVFVPPLEENEQTKSTPSSTPDNPKIDLEIYLPDANRPKNIEVAPSQVATHDVALDDYSETMLLRLESLTNQYSETVLLRLDKY